MFCATKRGGAGRGGLVFVAAHSGYGHKYKVQFCVLFLSFFLNDANMSMVVRIKKGRLYRETRLLI